MIPFLLLIRLHFFTNRFLREKDFRHYYCFNNRNYLVYT